MIILTNDLPNWEETSLNDLLLSLETGARPKGGVDRYKTGIPSLGGEHLTANGKFNLKNVKYIPEDFAEKLSRGKISQGDVLIVKDGATTGKCVLVQNDFPFEEAYINEHIFLCRFFPNLDSRFFAYYLRSDQGQKRILNNFRGAAQGGIPQSFANNTSVPVAPVNEQKRIVDKLDTLLAKVDACREHLERVPGILNRFRQAVLAAATSGRLTEEWREEHGSQKKWRLVRLAEIGKIGRGKSKHRPRNEIRLYGGPYPFIQTGDIAQSNGWIRTHRQTYSEFGLAQSKLWPTNTVCITIAANIANTAILSYPACFPDSVVGFIADPQKSLPQFIKWSIDVIKSDLETFAPATAQKNINLEVLNSLQIDCPDIEEQHEIVRRVEILFAYADKLESRYQAARNRVDSLTPSLLAKAFRGELVPQDANDEPAAVLLERIRDSKGLPSPDPKGLLPDL